MYKRQPVSAVFREDGRCLIVSPRKETDIFSGMSLIVICQFGLSLIHISLFGDFPIINQPLADEMEALREASQRFPRNEVARFIISDLDKAYAYMSAVDICLLYPSRCV